MAEERVQRRLAAILAADVVGYSRLMEADEVGTRARLRSLQTDLIEPKIAADGGRIVKTSGDGILVEFGSAVDAVRNALGVQRAVQQHNADVPEDRKIVFRVGINLGDVIVEGDDIHGDGVNVAARLEGLCGPGEVYVSGTVHDHVEGKLAATFDDLGEQTVKNIAKLVRVYRVREVTDEQSSRERVDAPLSLPDRPSIAVLPFENMSGDPEQEFFADGMAEDIITGLSRFRWLFVIARNSTFAFKDRFVGVKQVAKELGVRYVLEGSVRKGGNRIRLTAQLIDATTGNHLWAERYDRELEDVFAVQDEITEAIVAAIAPEISAIELKRAERKPPGNLDAWDIYQRGLAVYYTTTEEGLESAIELFDKVNGLDTEFAPAFAMAAEARFRYMFHFRPDNRVTLLKQAQEKSQKGIALDSRDPVCLMADGRVNTHLGRHDLAISQIKEAIALNPNYAMAHYALGFVLHAAGRAEETISHIDRAIRLSPHDAFLAGFQTWRAMALFDLKRYEEAVEWGRRASRNPNPRFWTFAVLAAALTKLGHEKEVQNALDELFAHAPRFSLGFVHEALNFLKAEFTEPFVEALREAGVPE